MAPSTRLIRVTLWLSVAFNLGAAALFAFPATPPGPQLGLPAAAPPLYAAMTAYLVALLAGAYAWLATRPVPDRPLLAFGAVGKAGVFVLAVALWAGGAVPPALVGLASGDPAFALVWLAWLLGPDAVS